MITKTLSQTCVGGLATIGVFALPTSVIAQDFLDRYDSCSQIADDAARLACFDRTHKEESETRVARAEAERARRADQFGFSATQINRREADAMAEAETSRDPVRIAAAEDASEQRDEEHNGVRDCSYFHTFLPPLAK